MQAQVSTQVPLLQSWPLGQLTPAQGSATQALRTQSWPVGHFTPAQSVGAGATQVK